MSRQQIIEGLKEEIRQRTPKSGEQVERAKKTLPNGEISSVRGFDPWPFYVDTAEGARVKDIDGNEYLDFCMGYGVLLFGHRPPQNLKVIQEHLETGPFHFGIPTTTEVEFSERFVKCVPCAEQVMVCNTGNEAVHKAVAVARAYTGKNKVAKFEGCFHGSNEYSLWSVLAIEEYMGSDERPNLIPMQSGMSAAAEEAMVLLPWGHEEAFKIIEENADELAVVMLEPALGPGALAFDPAYLRKLKEVCERCGVLLLFDEIITGFRLGLGGGQELFGVTPDIGLFGKSLGGGSPIGVVATRKEIFDKVLNLYPPLTLTGTFSGNVVSLKNSISVMDQLKEDPSLHEELAAKGDRLRAEFNSYAKERSYPTNMTGIGSMWQIHMTATPVKRPRDMVTIDDEVDEELNLRIRLKGIFVPEHSHIAFISTAHTNADIDELIRVLKESLDECFQ